MYISNVVASDYLDGKTYMCIKQNQRLRSLMEGDDQKISPQPSPTGTYRMPRRSTALLAPLVCTTGTNLHATNLSFYDNFEALSAHVIPDLRKKDASEKILKQIFLHYDL